MWCICLKWLAYCQGKSTNHRKMSRLKYCCFGQGYALPVAIEITAETYTLGMVATEAGMHSIYLRDGVSARGDSQPPA